MDSSESPAQLRDIPALSSASPARTADLGVLFIHGVGRQRRTQTLQRCALPLCHAVITWAGIADSVGTVVFGPVLAADCDSPPLPSPGLSVRQPGALIRLTLNLRENDMRTSQDWILAESCWADRKIASVIRRVLSGFRWKSFRRKNGGFPVPADELTWSRTGFIGGLRNAARNWQGRLVLAVGDLLVGRHDPGRWEVIVGGVTADLRWLSKRCDSVALIAHSHGAVIATEVLSRSALPNVALLITYGTVSRMFHHSADGGTGVADYWLDFVAASDPFAGRPMPATATGRGLRIHVQGSFVTAHWAYWRSTQQFTLPIVSALMAIGGKPLQRRAYGEDNAGHGLCLFVGLARPYGLGHSTALVCAAQA